MSQLYSSDSFVMNESFSHQSWYSETFLFFRKSPLDGGTYKRVLFINQLIGTTPSKSID